MRITVALCLLWVSQGLAINTYSQNTRLSLKHSNTTIRRVLQDIEDKTEFFFMYNGKFVDVEKVVSINASDELITKVLDKLFDNTGISYKIDERQIALSESVSASQVLQPRAITGNVIGSDGLPIPGATVVIKGTAMGAITDMDGNYNLSNVSGDAVLVFSFVGMKTIEISVGNQSVINVTIEDDSIGLDEVVAIGYGVQKKKLNTGSTVQLKGEIISKQSTVSAMTALQGQTPGVSIIKSTGEPGAGFKVNIRGMGTIGNSQPLYVIDGVPGGNIDYLSPSDIESIDVLKDAASAAIYGSRAANGVILVTTKRGKSAKAKANISVDSYYGWQNLYKKLPVANAQEYAMLQAETRLNGLTAPADFEALVPNWDKIQSGEWKGTDWLGELIVKDAPTQSHALSIFGNTGISNYSIGLTYTSQGGIVGNPSPSDYDRYSLRVNSDYSVIRDASDNFDILKVGESLRYSYSERQGIGTGNQYSNDIFSAIVANPFLPLYDENGDYHYAIDWSPAEANPIASMVYQRSQNKTVNHNLNANVYAEIQPIKNLIYKSSFGYNMSGGSFRSYVPVYSLSSTVFTVTDQINHNMNLGFDWTFENTLSYNFSMNEDHEFSLLAGTSAEKFGYGENISGINVNSVFDDFEHAYFDNTPVVNGDGQTSLGSNPRDIGGIYSLFGRVSYNYKEKYMATATVRRDASSNFITGKREGTFPSISAGWVVSEEDFLKDKIEILDFLKLRGSWGQNGNQDISKFQYLATISFSNVNYFFTENKSGVSAGAYPDILPNEDVTWETSEQTDFGFDARLFRGRMSVNFDWYNKTTKDWLVQPDNLAIYGTGAPYVNGGDVSNKGVELALGWNDQIGEVSYSVGVNFSHNKNEVTSIANSEGIIYGPSNVLGQGTTEIYRAEVGYPIGYFRGYKTLGVFQNADEVLAYTDANGSLIQPEAAPGDLIYSDTDGSGTITDEDKVMIGDPNPDYNVGLNFSLGYKGFDFSMMGSGSFGQQIARSWRRWEDSPLNNFTTDVFGRWHGEGSSNKLPRLYNVRNWSNISDIFIENADFFRINNLTVGYDLKTVLKDNLPLSQARVYLSVQNAYTFTKYSGMDPEIGTSTTSDDWAKGVDIGYYPSPRTVLIGVNLKF